MSISSVFKARNHFHVLATGRQLTFETSTPEKQLSKITLTMWGECHAVTKDIGPDARFNIYLITQTPKPETDYIEHACNVTLNEALQVMEHLEAMLEDEAKNRKKTYMDYSARKDAVHYSKIPFQGFKPNKNLVHALVQRLIAALFPEQEAHPHAPLKMRTMHVYHLEPRTNTTTTTCQEARLNLETHLWDIVPILEQRDGANINTTEHLSPHLTDMSYSEMIRMMQKLERFDTDSAQLNPHLWALKIPKDHFKDYMPPIAWKIATADLYGEPNVKAPQRRHYEHLSSRHP